MSRPLLEARAWKISTDPSREPLDTSDVQEFLDLDTTTELGLLDNLIQTARRHVEQMTGRALIFQTWDAWYAGFPGGGDFQVPKPPLISVDTFEFTDSDDTTSAVTASIYESDTDTEPGRIVLKHNETWPTNTLAETNPIHVQFTAGYGTEPDDVPESLRTAMRMLVNVWYQERRSEGAATRNEIQAARQLISDFRIRGVN